MEENCAPVTQDIDTRMEIQSRFSQTFRKSLFWLAMITITLLGAYLRFYQLGTGTIGNMYYAAAVKSMLTSWHNFIFASFEPGGSVTMNTPPLGFWIQTLSAKIFGFTGFALALPQALAGTLSIPLLYFIIQSQFKSQYGKLAGLSAALVLAITPISIAAERNNTVDGLLVFVLLLATWAFTHSCHSGKSWFIILGGFFIGIGFNIKMLQAYLIVPALFLSYLFYAPHTRRIRIRNMLLSAMVMILMSLSWVIAVQLVNPEYRPYLSGSQNNSAFDLIFGFNGTERLVSEESTEKINTAPQPSARPERQADNQSLLAGLLFDPFLHQKPEQQPMPPLATNPAQGSMTPNPPQKGMSAAPYPIPIPSPMGGNSIDNDYGRSDSPPTGQIGTNSQEIGQTGVGRLFSNPLADDISWLLPVAFLSIPLTIYIKWKWKTKDIEKPLFLWSIWLLSTWAFFSFSTTFFHTYYLIMLAPPIAALCGTCVWSIFYIFNKKRAAAIAVTLVLFTITFAFHIMVLRNDINLLNQVLFVSGTFFLVGILLFSESILSGNRKLSHIALSILLISLLVAPLNWSILSLYNRPPDPRLADVGPADQLTEHEIEFISPEQQNILDYLLDNTDSQNYLVATLTAVEASNFILETGRPVLPLGGFNGTDMVVTLEELQEMIHTGSLRFVLYHQDYKEYKPELGSWIIGNCSLVELSAPQVEDKETNPDMMESFDRPEGEEIELYDCLPNY